MATRAHNPTNNCDNRQRGRVRPLGGSISFNRIDQPAGTSSS